jgi:flagellin-like protein
MRGISAIIAVVLILLITISLAAGAYLFLFATMSQTTAAAQQGISQTMTQMTKSFTIEAVSGGKVWVRNTGQVPISNLTIYIDGAPANASNVVIQPGDVGVIQIYDVVDTSRPREIEIPGGTTTASKVVSGESLRDPTLVGYWKFDEGSGNIAYDSSGNGNDGILVNGPAWVDGKYGKALNFSGSNYVNISSSVGSISAVTAEAWIRKQADYMSFGGIVINTNWSYGIWISNSYISGGITNSSGGNSFTVISNVNPQKDVWYYVAMTYDSLGDQVVRLYINGTLVGTRNAIGPTEIPRGVIMGGKDPYYCCFKGTIDEVRIYNRALSVDEIWNHYVHGPI